jgi:hypothetical protein
MTDVVLHPCRYSFRQSFYKNIFRKTYTFKTNVNIIELLKQTHQMDLNY